MRKTQKASKTIKNFIVKQNKSGKITNIFLRNVCTKSGACMVFGRELNTIRKYFDGFTTFKYVADKKRVGEVSNNGFVIELENERGGYSAHTILKSSMEPNSDNLAYEYYVGINFINIICERFPCFLETYGLYYYKDEASWNLAQTDPKNMNLLTDLKQETMVDFGKACLESKYISILIQHVDKPVSLQSLLNNTLLLLDKRKRDYFFNVELVYILLQVYYPLACLQDHFTHYDLHSSNILIYTLPNGECVEYSFIDYETGTPMTFKTRYLVKIIDYGRSYFYTNNRVNSREVYHEVCGKKDCNKRIIHNNKVFTASCGSEFGFELFNIKDFYHIDSMKRNKSHDLRLFCNIVYNFYDFKIKPTISEYCKMISKKSSLYQVCGDLIYEQYYGTPELKSDPRDNKIRNVGDLYKRLFGVINDSEYKDDNSDRFKDMKCVCKFDIKGDRRMVVTY